MGGMLEDVLQRSGFHDLAGVDDGDLLAHLRHDAEVVGDEYGRGFVLLVQRAHQVQHLGLDGHVQRRGGLVGQQQLRGTGQGDGDDHALLHAAGELMRVFIVAMGGNAHHFQHLLRLSAHLGGALVAVQPDDLGDLLAHGDDRVQGGHGVLEDHRDALAAHVVHLFLAQFQKVPAVEPDSAVLDHGRRLLEHAQYGPGDGRLARAGLAHQAQHLALFQLQGDVVDRMNRLRFRHIFDGQIVDLQKSLVIVHDCRLTSSAWGRGRRAGRRPAGSGSAPPA